MLWFCASETKITQTKKYLSLILTWIECNKTYETNTNITSFHAHTFDCWFVFLRNLVDCVCCWFRYNTHASKFSHKNTVTQRPIELISCVYECRWFVFEWIFRFLLRSYFFFICIVFNHTEWLLDCFCSQCDYCVLEHRTYFHTIRDITVTACKIVYTYSAEPSRTERCAWFGHESNMRST